MEDSVNNYTTDSLFFFDTYFSIITEEKQVRPNKAWSSPFVSYLNIVNPAKLW